MIVEKLDLLSIKKNLTILISYIKKLLFLMKQKKYKYDITEKCYKSDRKYLFPNRKPYKDFYNHIEIFYIEDNKKIIVFEYEV